MNKESPCDSPLALSQTQTPRFPQRVSSGTGVRTVPRFGPLQQRGSYLYHQSRSERVSASPSGWTQGGRVVSRNYTSLYTFGTHDPSSHCQRQAPSSRASVRPEGLKTGDGRLSVGSFSTDTPACPCPARTFCRRPSNIGYQRFI